MKLAEVLAILCSGRRKGFTATLLSHAAASAESVKGVGVERVHLQSYTFRPCNSCFNCIRSPDHTCTLDDDFGRRGKGELFEKIEGANGIILADPVHNWGPSATCRLLFERCYPFLWSGRLNGLPFASISCASNQGMQHLALREICKWAFGYGMLYIGGVDVHTAYFEEAIGRAKSLGEKVAEAALRDSTSGRAKFLDNETRFQYYDTQTPWNPLEPYLENLTRGTFRWEESVIARALSEGRFENPEAEELLRMAEPPLKEALNCFAAGDRRSAIKALVKASALWTQATWKEFLEGDVIRASVPPAYLSASGGGASGSRSGDDLKS
ncbi:MAG: flavodoxin family protein [bacterium]